MALANRGGVLTLSLAVALLLLAVATSASFPSLSLPVLVPAFVWSNHRQLDSHLPASVRYETFSSEDFIGKVKHEFLWPTMQQEDVKQDVVGLDVVMVFIGTQLRSGDVSRAGGTRTSNLLEVLKSVVSSSKSSVSLPYVTPPRDGASVKDLLVREIVGDAWNSEARLGEVITSGACLNKDFTKRFSSMEALQEYLPVRMRTKVSGKTDLVVLCGSSEEESSGPKSVPEGQILDEILRGMDQMETRYVALYTTDLSGENAFPSRPRGRQLGSVVYEDEEYCNEVCQTKATILEGLLVGLTLLIILISGLCCMSGITTPSRFEKSPDAGQ